jgi:hypothetical protein
MYVAGTLHGDMLFSLWYRRTNRYIQAEREAQKIVQQGMCPLVTPSSSSLSIQTRPDY